MTAHLDSSPAALADVLPPAPPQPSVGAALPAPARDITPLLLVPLLILAMLPLIGSFSSWLTLTAAGLAMGMMIFIMAAV